MHDIDTNVVYYVAGYIGCGVSRQLRCSNCKSCLVANALSEEPDAVDLVDSKRTLLDMADRGGLAAPTEVAFSVCAIGYLCYYVLREHAILMKRLLLQINHRALYVVAVTKVVQRELDIVEVSCTTMNVFQIMY